MSSLTAHGIVLAGIGSLFVPAQYDLTRSPASMELVFSLGEEKTGAIVPFIEKTLPQDTVKKEEINKKEIFTIKEPEITALAQKEPASKTENTLKESPVSPALSQTVHGSDIGPLASGTDLKTHGPCIEINPAPRYPRAARRRGYEGTTQLKVFISSKGKAEKVAVLQSSGHPVLDRAAAETIRQWVFYPAKKMGIPVSSELIVPVVFQIKE